jgi:hypothetical protein
MTEGVPLTQETWNSIAAAAIGVGLDDARVNQSLIRL